MKRKKGIRRTKEDYAVDLFVWVVLIIFSFLCVYPFWFIIVASFNDGYDMMRGGVYWWPRVFTLENYKTFFAQSAWMDAIRVSVQRTAAGTALTVIFTCLVSYALSRRNLMFGKFYRFLFIFSMYVSGGLIPYYFILRLL